MTTIRSSLRSIGAATAVGAVLLVGMPAGSSAAGTSAADEVPILGQAFTMAALVAAAVLSASAAHAATPFRVTNIEIKPGLDNIRGPITAGRFAVLHGQRRADLG